MAVSGRTLSNRGRSGSRSGRQRGARRWRVAVAGIASLAMMLALAVPAFGGRPPLGNYNCYLNGSYTLSFKLKSRTRYKTPDGGGKYRYNRDTHRIRFKSGPFHRYGWKGKHRHLRGGGEPIIILRGKTNGHRFKMKCEHTRLN